MCETTVHAFLIAFTAALLGGAHASAHHSPAERHDATGEPASV